MSTLQNQVLRGYEFQEQVGAGGFGVVYRALQPAVGREVAVKVILPQHANHPDFIRRFEFEAQFVARLEHPHIVPLYDYWREPDGAYLVMRWLPKTLRRVLDEHGAWAVKETALLLDQITAALAVAHRQGVIHRDIKPDNILLDEDGNTYLADFGIAKDLKATGISGEEAIVGSPVYLTPEQIKSEPVSPQTDIYSLGIVLYEMLTGEKPFPNLAATALLMKHLYDPLPPLSALRPELPSALDAVIQKATAKEPARRYHEVLELSTAFRTAAQSPRYEADQLLLGPLTPRELDIMRLIAGDMSNQEIAEQLVLSPGTVKWYVKQIFSKLDVHNRTQAAGRAREIVEQIANRKAAAIKGAYEDESEELLIVTEMVRPYDLAALPLENPYKGLRAFQEADAADFFGREALIGQLVKRLKEETEHNRFLAVIGPSGSGKSSVVRAGLVPGLRRGVLPKSECWFVVEMLPGSHPLEELEAALLRIAVNPPDSLINQLREDERGLLRAIKRVLPPEEEVELVIVIDQFEELFTLVESEEVRSHFLNSLVAAVADPQSRVHVIVTLRADFTDQPLLYPRFGKLISQRSEFVLPLNVDEVKQAITAPAGRVGLTVDTDLVGEIIREVVTQPGTLPLLEYALSELFEQREGNRLTLDTYRASGGVLKALARRADDLFEELTPESKQAARQMFLRLVTLGEGTDDARRRTLQSEVMSVVDNPQVMDDVIDVYSQYRLLTLDRDPISRGPTVEVAHEALLREWGRLRDWLNESRADIRQQRQLASAAREWEKSGKEASFLLRGSRLVQFETWTAATDLALTELERGYLDTSLSHRGEEQVAESSRQAREVALQRSAANRLRYLVGVLALFLIVATGLALFALASRNDAIIQQNLAAGNAVRSDALRLAADADSVLSGGSGELATLLAIRSVNTTYSPQGDAALQQALTHNYAQQLFTGHTDRVWAVAYSPDGATVLTGSFDKTARLWDVRTGQELRQFVGHTEQINSVVFSPDSRLALTASDDGTARLWDAQTGHELRQFVGHTSGVWSAAISPDGRFVLTGSADKTARLWDAQTGKELRQFIGHTGAVRSVAFSPTGDIVLTASDEARLWTAATGEEIRRFTNPNTDGIFAAALSSDGRYVLIGSGKTASLWDAQTGAELHTFVGHTDFIFSVAFSPDGRYVATGSVDTTARVWDLESGQQVRLFAGHVGTVYGVAFSPDSRLLLTGSKDLTARLWAIEQPPEPGRFVGHTAAVYAVAYSPDGRSILTGGSDNTARLWDAQTGLQLQSFTGHSAVVSSVAFSPDGRLVLTGSYNSTARLWDAQTGLEQGQFDEHSGPINSVAFSPDGTLALTASDDGTARLWDIQMGREVQKFTDPDGRFVQAVFSPDGRSIFTGGDGKMARLWDVQTGQGIRQFDGHTDSIYGVAFSPDGRTVLTGSLDKTARLWDVETGQQIRLFRGHREWVFGVAFSPDGNYILTSSYDKSARLWDVQTGQEVRRFVGHTGAVVSVAFSPDGRYVLTGSYDYTAQRSAIDYQELVQTACSRVLRDFTDDERIQFELNDTQATCPAS